MIYKTSKKRAKIISWILLFSIWGPIGCIILISPESIRLQETSLVDRIGGMVFVLFPVGLFLFRFDERNWVEITDTQVRVVQTFTTKTILLSDLTALRYRNHGDESHEIQFLVNSSVKARVRTGLWTTQQAGDFINEIKAKRAHIELQDFPKNYPKWISL